MAPAFLRSESAEDLRIPIPWGHVCAKAWGDKAKGIPVLGLHGWMDNAGTFDRLVPHLSGSIYFVALELPGHGLSPPIPSGFPYHFIDSFTVIRRVAEYLKWSKFSILGHSMGGAIASLFASIFPQLVDKLIMLDIVMSLILSSHEGPTSHTWHDTAEQFIREDAKLVTPAPRYSPQEAVELLITAVSANVGDSLTQTAAKCLMDRGTVKHSDGRVSFRRDNRLQVPSLYRFSNDDSLRVLQSIKCHLLIIRVNSKTARPVFEAPDHIIVKTLDIFKSKCASFQWVEVEGNHFVHLNEPKKVSDFMNNFFLRGDAHNVP